ncbi:D-alanyl-lipoteichoic acid biosynthesis protein DltB [Numidum massiliense]|uniref:D-alanyl-lipoteichoic acid biosynthesis protein DltB n=1 Tax=Numidum massiliense TaxID=1522315 RepID=UPI0006D59920|nr:D-alanyl-lipoteichoic acid biosynthesis protein DltB [Numidum massiliense]
MTPYETLPFFLLLAVLLLPTVIAGLREKPLITYNLVLTLLFVGIIFYDKWWELFWLCLYVVWQTLLIKTYLAYRRKQNATSVFVAAVILAIVPLLTAKLTLSSLFAAPGGAKWFAFLGISYLTFKSVQMVMEIRDGLIKEVGTIDFLRFLLFFPTLASGPIDRWRRFQKDTARTLNREEYIDYLYSGINRIFQGFLYKFIIAFLLNTYVLETAFVQSDKPLATLLYMYAYSLYLFFDFAGYSSFAIGVSRMMGVQTPENFNKPFISRNIKDFWNRWHMSLSFWFRDYVYMRLVFWLTKKKLLKNRYTISYIGYFALFLLMGLWHGLQWNYIVYGLYHAVMIISFDWLERKNKKHKFWPDNRFTHVLAVVVTFNFICFGLLIFSERGAAFFG